MYVLYYAPGTASFAVHWLLLELGVPFETRLVDLEAKAQKEPEYLRLNPRGTVPTLIVDGVPRHETAALLLLLAERHRAAGFEVAPDAPARADYLQWMLYLANTVQPLFRNWFYVDEVAGAECAKAVKAHTRARIEAAWDLAATRLGETPYLAGDCVSAVDFLAAMLMFWSHDLRKPAGEWPALNAYLGRLRARPVFSKLLAREGLGWPFGAK